MEDNIDIYVGNRIKLRRKEMKISLRGLAKEIGLSYQQIQKYETGQNRLSSSILYKLSQILKVDMSYFFSGYSENNYLDENDKILLELIGAFNKLEETKRLNVLSLVKDLSSND